MVLFCIAGLLLASILSHSWFRSEGGGIGMLGLKFCGSHGCESQLWFGMHGAPKSLVLLALLGLGGGLAVIAMLGHTAIMMSYRDHDDPRHAAPGAVGFA